MSSTIIGTGSYVPEHVVTNDELQDRVNTDSAWVEEQLGIKERRILDTGRTTSDMAVIAAQRALSHAGISVRDVDLIIVATATPDRIAPSTATIVQHKLGAIWAAAFDLNAVCTGFLYAVHIANQFVDNGVYRNVLVIGADTFSRITDWTDRKCVFFGDGAGTVVISKGMTGGGFIETNLYADGSGRDGFTVPAGGAECPTTPLTLDLSLGKFQMDGKAVFRTAITVLPEAISRILDSNGHAVSDIDWVIPHQPSIKILRKTAEIAGIPFSKVCTNMDKYANTSGATVPLLLDEKVKDGTIQKGNLLLFLAVGSGWTWGVSLMRWTL